MLQAGFYIIKTLSQLFIMLFLLRLLFPWFHINYRNPAVQGIFRLTSSFINPIRRLIPPIGKIDTATLIVTFLIQYFVIFLLLILNQKMLAAHMIAFVSIIEICIQSVNLFFFAIIIKIVFSWIGPKIYNPIAEIAGSISDPILKPFRKLIPPLGGIDFSHIFAIICIQAIIIFFQSIKPYYL